MDQGYIALLDVLGFSSLLSGDGGGKRLQRYMECLKEALDDEAFGLKVDYVVFSDSIVLTTGGSDEFLQILLRRCSRLFGIMLENEIPLRGAIAHGPYLREAVSGSVFVAGTPIVEAYRFESAQDWVGIMLAPSVVRQVPDLAQRCWIEDHDTPEARAHLV